MRLTNRRSSFCSTLLLLSALGELKCIDLSITKLQIPNLELVKRKCEGKNECIIVNFETILIEVYGH